MRPARILVTGFQRSGPTLLRRLLCIHPKVRVVLHEARLLTNARTKKEACEQAVRFAKDRHQTTLDPVSDNWGDKVPFCVSKPSVGIVYCQKWMEMFGDGAKVALIVRHPCDIVVSSKRSFSQGPANIMRAVHAFMPGFVQFGLDSKRVHCLKFEELVSSPRSAMKGVFDFFDLDSGSSVLAHVADAGRDELRYFDGIEEDRAFAYREHPWRGPPVSNELLNVLNQVKGPKYELPVGP